MRSTLRLATVAAVIGCGSPPDPATGREADLEAGVRALSRTVGLSTAFVGGGAIDANAPPETVASAIYQRFLVQATGCGTAMLNGAAVDADVSKVCMLQAAGMKAGGTVHIDVSKPSAGQALLLFTLQITVDGGQPLTGTLKYITSNSGNSDIYGADVMFAGVHANVPNLNVGVSGGGATFDSKGTLTGKSNTAGWTLATVTLHQDFAACYPDGGTAELSGPSNGTNVDELSTFTHDSGGNGAITLGAPGGQAPRSFTLPPRMGCPSTPPAPSM